MINLYHIFIDRSLLFTAVIFLTNWFHVYAQRPKATVRLDKHRVMPAPGNCNHISAQIHSLWSILIDKRTNPKLTIIVGPHCP